VCSVILFSFSIRLAAAIIITFVRLKHQRYSCWLHITTLLSFLSCGSTVIAVCCHYHRGKKRLINSVTFFFVGSGSAAVATQRQRWQRRQHNGSSHLGSGGGSLAEAQF
jgi:hypothetical protein